MPSTNASRLPLTAALLLGVSLGGFFDGILLHQVLGWHHLLSNVDAARDLRTQLLADGLFHALMYLLAVGALVRLARARASLGAAGAGQALLVRVLFGFALWHLLDALLSHWITGIHRVRVDVPNPLAWDVGWLAVFGGLPFAAALWWRRRPPGGKGRGAAAALSLLAVMAGSWAAWPSPRDGGGESLVLFAPGLGGARAFDALARLDARVRWVDAGGGAWLVRWDRTPDFSTLLKEGALAASALPLAVGCATWTGPDR